jgi:hypothetical protein
MQSFKIAFDLLHREVYGTDMLGFSDKKWRSVRNPAGVGFGLWAMAATYLCFFNPDIDNLSNLDIGLFATTVLGSLVAAVKIGTAMHAKED